MAKDVAFLFYPGDWLGGTLLMSRHHKGAYMDLLVAQFNNGHMALQEIKTLLGKEDENLWEEVLSKKFVQDSEGKYYNEKLDKEIVKRRGFTSSRTNNLKKNLNTSSHTEGHMVAHMDNGNGIDNGIEKEGGAGENKINIPFETFWDLYDKKEDRIKCERKWSHLTNKEREECIKKLPAYIKSTPDKKFRKNPATYLNNKSWENEIIPLMRSTFGIPQRERDYTTPQTSFS